MPESDAPPVTPESTGASTPEEPRPNAQSKELTDKIHRLIRKFSRELVKLVAEEIGARSVRIKNKPGPKLGHKARRQVCPLCRKNENPFRRFGFICRPCRTGKPLARGQKMKKHFPEFKKKKRDQLGQDFKIEVPVVEHIPAKSVEVEDAEPDFLDSLAEIINNAAQENNERRKKPKTQDDTASEADWDFFT